MAPGLAVIAPYGDGLITSAGFLRDFAGTIEEGGVDSVWTVEHVIVADAYDPKYPYSSDGRMPSAAGVVPMPDPLELLAFFAALTTRLRFGTAVVVAPLHSPAVLAKRAATLDRLSDGRFMLGLGIGWQREEYAAVGAAFSQRGARLEESIGAMRALWADSPATFEGRFTSFRAVHSEPHPINGTVPIVLGGNTDAAVTRAARVADGWFPYAISADEFAQQADVFRAVGRRRRTRRSRDHGVAGKLRPDAASASSTGCAATSTPARPRWPSVSRSALPPTSPASPTTWRATATRCSTSSDQSLSRAQSMTAWRWWIRHLPSMRRTSSR